jgi:hypothetical protein
MGRLLAATARQLDKTAFFLSQGGHRLGRHTEPLKFHVLLVRGLL